MRKRLSRRKARRRSRESVAPRQALTRRGIRPDGVSSSRPQWDASLLPFPALASRPGSLRSSPLGQANGPSPRAHSPVPSSMRVFILLLPCIAYAPPERAASEGSARKPPAAVWNLGQRTGRSVREQAPIQNQNCKTGDRLRRTRAFGEPHGQARSHKRLDLAGAIQGQFLQMKSRRCSGDRHRSSQILATSSGLTLRLRRFLLGMAAVMAAIDPWILHRR